MVRNGGHSLKVLLTDGGQRSALAATRSLGRAGMQVFVGETYAPNLAGSSRFCHARLTYPPPATDEAAFVAAIADAVRREGIDLVIPVSDISSSVLAAHRKELEGLTRVAVVDEGTFWAASDKNALHRLADRLGIPTPTLSYVDHPDEVCTYADRLTFPVVVKPSRSRLRVNGTWLRTAVKRVQSKAELLDLVRRSPELQHPFMLQREVRGEGRGVFALCARGEPLALFAHRRIREKPPWGGVSVLRESVAPDPDLARAASQLLRHLEWHGAAMVEFKRDAADGTGYLMEVNGRLWGSLQLAVDAGIDFPVLLARLYLGEPVPPQGAYRTGIRSRWLLGDVDHLLKRLSSASRTGETGQPPLGALVWDFVKFYRKDTYYEIESRQDPGPAWYEMRQYLREVLRGPRSV